MLAGLSDMSVLGIAQAIAQSKNAGPRGQAPLAGLRRRADMNTLEMTKQLSSFAAEHQTLLRTVNALTSRLIDNGPVAHNDVARLLGCHEAEVDGVLSRMWLKVDWDKDGRLVGAGLTLRPTPHRIEIEGKRAFAWCALDTLLFPLLLERTARVSSPCAATGSTVFLTVSRDGIAQPEPAEAVISAVMPDSRGSDIRQAFCVHVNFYSSKDTAQTWVSEHPDAALLSLQEAFTFARDLARRMQGQSL